MPNRIKSTDGLVVFWITHILIISSLYLVINQPREILDTGNWLLLLWVFFVLSIPSLLMTILVHFLLYQVEERHKRYGIRLMSWITFLVTFELWKDTDGQTNFLSPYFQETFGFAASLLAVSHFLTYQLLRRVKERLTPAVNS